jgi:cell shape-determining protein MreC
MLDSFKDLVDKFDNNIDIHKIASIDLKNYLCCSSHKIFLQNPQKIQIKENLPVLAGGSFIGQTSKQYLNLIEVILFSDSNHVLPVKSDIFYCNARGKGKPLLISCSPKINIKDLGSKIGDSIYTSGLGGIFIKDTEIGFISDISMDSAGELEVIITLLGNPLEENFYGSIGNLVDEA